MPNIYLHPHQSIYFLFFIYYLFLSSIYLYHKASAVNKSKSYDQEIWKNKSYDQEIWKTAKPILKNQGIMF